MIRQINLQDIFPEKSRFTSKRCAATLEDCSHTMGTCAESCCQYCNMGCGSRCSYSVGQKKVKVGNDWVENPDYKFRE